MTHSKKYRHLALYMVVLIFSTACFDLDNRAIDKKEVVQQIRDHKPKRVLDSELLRWCALKGDMMSQMLQKNLIKTAAKQGIPPERFATIPRASVQDSLAAVYKVQIKRIDWASASNTALSPEENTAMGSYRNPNREPKSQAMFRKGNQEIVYCAPIVFVGAEVLGMWVIVFDRREAIRRYEYKDLYGL